MNQKFESPNELPWLKTKYAMKIERTYDLGVKAINSLLKEGIKPTFRKIAERAKELDKEKKGFHPNTVKTNEKLYQYYLSKCSFSTYKKKQKIKIVEQDFKNIKLDRDLERTKSRYLKLSKIELVQLLINAEQHIAEQNRVWLKDQFESFQ